MSLRYPTCTRPLPQQLHPTTQNTQHQHTTPIASDSSPHHHHPTSQWSCGKVGSRRFPDSASRWGHQCQVWSIGSAGLTCFEEFVHLHAPACEMHTFDPTLTPKANAHVKQLAMKSVLRFHQIGLASGPSSGTASLHRCVICHEA